jgi:molybdenum cofactor cytidylyltransferase
MNLLAAARRPNMACLVLAAGGSTRLGRPKQLLRHGGRTLLARAVAAGARHAATPPVVVLGADRLRLRATLQRERLRCRVAVNARWREGMGSSLAAGIAALPRSADAVLVLLVDQPAVTGATLAPLVAAWRRRPRVAAAARYAGRVGVPAILPRTMLRRAKRLGGDFGARELLRAERALTLVDLPEAAFDVDTEADAARLGESRRADDAMTRQRGRANAPSSRS